MGIPQSFVAHSKLMFDLLTLAWQAEITRVSTFMVAREVSGRVYGESGINDPFHNLSHHSEVPANIEKLARLNAFHTSSTIGYFVKRLSETPDGDGTLLDHALVLGYTDVSDARLHAVDGIPMFLAGAAGGRIKTGLHIAGRGDTVSRVGLTAQQAMGLAVDRWGAGANQSASAIGELLA